MTLGVLQARLSGHLLMQVEVGPAHFITVNINGTTMEPQALLGWRMMKNEHSFFKGCKSQGRDNESCIYTVI